ncbi:zinc/iron transporter [Neurospora intermedia]|uniref:Zinc/iron transporter n=1 Tax=Neurospora intermedia TaxID=5142 RepID=A0ABR3DSH2_NEUIN
MARLISSKRKLILQYALTALLFQSTSASQMQHRAPQVTAAPTATTAPAAVPTAISGCHLHNTEVFCLAGETEYSIHTTATATSELPAQFTGCHSHDDALFCVTPSGDDVEISPVTEESEQGHDDHDHDEDEVTSSTSTSEKKCHFHAGVEHCTGGDEHEEESATCERTDRDYNIRLRVGLLFAMLATSSIGVFGPILLSNFVSPNNVFVTILRQFGTGVVISTAFIHLLSHAQLMFANECLGELSYEGTASAISMAGIFISFLAEYLGVRVLQWHAAKTEARNIENGGEKGDSAQRTEMVNILVLECGVIFHSILIGITLVVAGDTFFLTLFAVIVFHQMFEGIALGSRIAALGTLPPINAASSVHGHSHHGHSHHGHSHHHAHEVKRSSLPTESASPTGTDHGVVSEDESARVTVIKPVSLKKKLLLASGFALVTPIGMAIGIGVLKQFNGNDPSTIIAIGTLDALSAGILMWVGIVEMWAHDWMLGGEMTTASPIRTLAGLTALVAGLALMSLLGKWA